MMAPPLLRVRGLGVQLDAAAGARPLLRDVDFGLARGEALGIVGRSGAGKSTLGLALLRLLPEGARLADTTSIQLDGEELVTLDAGAMRTRRGRRIAMIFQEPLQALDPAMRVGDQLAEALLVHGLAEGGEAMARAVSMLDRVGIADARWASRAYPHEFSGGMRQRLLIATALLPGPDLLIADEPTTALDPTVQAQVLDLLDQLRAASGVALVLISHDLDVVGERCGRILVLDEGRVVEEESAAVLLRSPRSVAGERLVGARRAIRVPRRLDGAAAGSTATSTLLEVTDLRVHYPLHGRRAREGHVVRAVDGVSLTIARGETLGLVGESGCGKTSFGHAVLRLGPSTGAIRFDGIDLPTLAGESLRKLRRRMQLVSQDAGASLTPHLTCEMLVREGLEVHGLAVGAAARTRARALLAEMGLPDRAARALPRELSAGERQRVAIARALATSPDLLVCDEPVASVDAPTREHLLDLLDGLRRDRGLAMLFISHDLAAVGRVAARVAVMYLGRVVESGPTERVLAAPHMPYTRALLSAVPTGDPAARETRTVLVGAPPSPTARLVGCPFQPRCPHPAKDAQCLEAPPPLEAREPAHAAACWKG